MSTRAIRSRQKPIKFKRPANGGALHAQLLKLDLRQRVGDFSDNPQAALVEWRFRAGWRRWWIIIERDGSNACFAASRLPDCSAFYIDVFVGMLKPNLGHPILGQINRLGFSSLSWPSRRRLQIGTSGYTRARDRLHESVLRAQRRGRKPFSRISQPRFVRWNCSQSRSWHSFGNIGNILQYDGNLFASICTLKWFSIRRLPF